MLANETITAAEAAILTAAEETLRALAKRYMYSHDDTPARASSVTRISECFDAARGAISNARITLDVYGPKAVEITPQSLRVTNADELRPVAVTA